MSPTKEKKANQCGQECQNGLRTFYFMNKSRKTLRFEIVICPFCNPEIPNDFRKLSCETRIPQESFNELRDKCGWRVETLDEALTNFRLIKLAGLTISKLN